MLCVVVYVESERKSQNRKQVRADNPKATHNPVRSLSRLHPTRNASKNGGQMSTLEESVEDNDDVEGMQGQQQQQAPDGAAGANATGTCSTAVGGGRRNRRSTSPAVMGEGSSTSSGVGGEANAKPASPKRSVAVVRRQSVSKVRVGMRAVSNVEFVRMIV